MSDEVVELPIPPSDAVPFERPSGKDWSDVGEETLAGYLSKLAPTLVAHAKLSTVGREAVMRALPTGYVLLQQMRASGSYVDKYLFGVNEFIPHLAFLCARQTDASAVCQCKHCASFSAKKKTNSATPSPAPPSSSAATTPRFEPGKRKQPLAHPLAKTSSRRSSLATGAAHSRSHGSPSASDAEPDGDSGNLAKRLKTNDSYTVENDAKANNASNGKGKRSRSSSIAPPAPSPLVVAPKDMMNVDEAENEEELPPFAKTVISLPASSDRPQC
ncbi:hypothetical protein BC830DRAFT_1174044 [Chytriomyces sp. MP71]|nr:hypothetical protein BC830DRAFT_1174044 [Chytriomyces sp. MP71]